MGEKGFEIYSSAPSEKPFSSSSSSPFAVSMMTGTSDCSLISDNTSMPFRFGIITSSITREISLSP